MAKTVVRVHTHTHTQGNLIEIKRAIVNSFSFGIYKTDRLII